MLDYGSGFGSRSLRQWLSRRQRQLVGIFTSVFKDNKSLWSQNTVEINVFLIFLLVYSRVPDPEWIRIQSGQWIRIRIRFRNPDPDPGGQKLPTKVEKKIHVLKCWMTSFERQSDHFFCLVSLRHFTGPLILMKKSLWAPLFSGYISSVVFPIWPLNYWPSDYFRLDTDFSLVVKHLPLGDSMISVSHTVKSCNFVILL